MNAFFVGAEMALARVRRTRIDQIVDEGNVAARLVQKHLVDPDRYISACQLGITLATLGMGFVGESAFAGAIFAKLEQLEAANKFPEIAVTASHAICFGGAFIITAFLQTVVGELIPKKWTFQRAESAILLCIYPMEWWCFVTAKLITILNYSSDIVLRLLKVQSVPLRHSVHTEEELKMLVSASHEEGVLEPEEEEMLHSVFDFSDTVASEIMTPRTDMVCIPANNSVKRFVDLALEHGHSRIPIYEEDLDNIFGLVHIRDGLRALVEHKENSQVREFARKVLIVPENKSLGDLLTEFKKTKTHMAIVVDEYGGTRGMVTFEDLLEELVGDIADEHEIVEEYIVEEPDGTVLLDAKLSLEEVNDKLDLDIEDEDYNTLGGHVFGLLGREPKPGDEVSTDLYVLRIEESDRHRIIKLRLIHKEPPVVAENNDGGNHPTENGGTKPPANKRTVEFNI